MLSSPEPIPSIVDLIPIKTNTEIHPNTIMNIVGMIIVFKVKNKEELLRLLPWLMGISQKVASITGFEPVI